MEGSGGTGRIELKGMNEMERRAVGNREDGKLEQNVGREDGKEIGCEIRDKSSDYDCIR